MQRISCTASLDILHSMLQCYSCPLQYLTPADHACASSLLTIQTACTAVWLAGFWPVAPWLQ